MDFILNSSKNAKIKKQNVIILNSIKSKTTHQFS